MSILGAEQDVTVRRQAIADSCKCRVCRQHERLDATGDRECQQFVDETVGFGQRLVHLPAGADPQWTTLRRSHYERCACAERLTSFRTLALTALTTPLAHGPRLPVERQERGSPCAGTIGFEGV